MLSALYKYYEQIRDLTASFDHAILVIRPPSFSSPGGLHAEGGIAPLPPPADIWFKEIRGHLLLKCLRWIFDVHADRLIR